MDESAGRRQRWKQQALTKWLTAAQGGAPFGCLIGGLYPSIRPRAHPPRAALPLGAEADDPYGSRFSPLLIATPPTRQSRAGRSLPPRRPATHRCVPRRLRPEKTPATRRVARHTNRAAYTLRFGRIGRPAALPLRRAEISHRSIGPSAGCKPILLGRLQLYLCLTALCDLRSLGPAGAAGHSNRAASTPFGLVPTPEQLCRIL